MNASVQAVDGLTARACSIISIRKILFIKKCILFLLETVNGYVRILLLKYGI